MLFSKVTLASSVLALTLMAAMPASAQRVVVFGDSLSDTGNVAALGGVSSPKGRFSDGLNWIDLLYGTTNTATPVIVGGQIAGFTVNPTGNVDLAFGAARTDSASNPTGTTTPGIPTQIGIFVGNGGKFSASDTVAMWGGANNIFQFIGINVATNQLQNLTSTSLTATGIADANSQLANVGTVIGLGAKKVVVLNLPDLGSTPQFNTTALASGATLSSQTFNSQLASGLAGIAGSNAGVNIVQADIAALFRIVIANPTAFGFTNVTTACSTGAPFKASCSGFLFADSVHPTQAAYAYVAQYVGLLSDTAPALQQTSRLGETGLYTNELVTNQVFDRMSAFVSGTYADRNGPYAEIIGSYATYDGSGGGPGYQMSIGGVRAGIDKKSGATLTGGSVTYLAGSLSTGSIKSDLTTFRGDIYSTALFGNAYVSADASIANLDLTGIQRQTGFPTIVAQGTTGGYVASAAAEAGFVQTFGAVTIIPSARVTYFHSQLDGYSETADLLAMSYNDRQIDAVLIGGKVRAVTPISGMGLSATAFGEVGYEGFVSSSNGNVTAQLIGNTALPTTINPGDPNGPGILGKVGLSSEISAGTFFDFQYGIAVHDNGGETHSGDVRLKATY